jgi:hypothetical protein
MYTWRNTKHICALRCFPETLLYSRGTACVAENWVCSVASCGVSSDCYTLLCNVTASTVLLRGACARTCPAVCRRAMPWANSSTIFSGDSTQNTLICKHCPSYVKCWKAETCCKRLMNRLCWWKQNNKETVCNFVTGWAISKTRLSINQNVAGI